MGGSSHEYCESPDLEPTSRDDSWCELRDEPYTGPVPAGDNDRASTIDAVGPGYFSTLEAPIMLGRDISEGDSGAAPRVTVVNEAFADRVFARRNPLGMRITVIESDDARTTYRVVGVARNTRTDNVRDAIGRAAGSSDVRAGHVAAALSRAGRGLPAGTPGVATGANRGAARRVIRARLSRSLDVNLPPPRSVWSPSPAAEV